MKYTPEEIGRKMDALDLWDVLLPFNWAIKARGVATPYFCTVMRGEIEPVKVRFLLLEGWQTLNDYLHTRQDRFYGVCSSPMELPHLELIVLKNGELKLFRHVPGYLPLEVKAGTYFELAARLLWEAYGVMLRLEGDRQLPMKYSEEGSIFARVEQADGVWEDQPLAVPTPAPYTERIVLQKADLKAAADLPLAMKDAISMDFRLVPGCITQEARPRTVYELVGFDFASKKELFRGRVSVAPEGNLKAMWQNMPTQLLKIFVQLGRVPGTLHLVSGRVFRFLRPICLELPVRLVMHDKLDELTI